jgi:rRNA biogenesis protein RRP5
VKAVILSVDLEKKRVSFGLKPSYFQDDEDPGSDSEEEEEPEPENLGVVEDDVEMVEVDAQRSAEESSEGEESNDEEVMQVDGVDTISFGKPSASSSNSIPTLNVQNGFQWSNPNANAEESESSSASEADSENEGKGGKKKKRKRKEIELDLTADMHTKTPESNADFERLLLGSPNSSFLWIQYMSFQLQLSEVDKAREVARRALKTINFREEQEKLNVWISLLNLENVYGTDESIEATFKDAARHNDSKTVHLRLASIFDQSEKYEVSSFFGVVFIPC